MLVRFGTAALRFLTMDLQALAVLLASLYPCPCSSRDLCLFGHSLLIGREVNLTLGVDYVIKLG